MRANAHNYVYACACAWVFLCVCVCVCVRTRVCVCVCVCTPPGKICVMTMSTAQLFKNNCAYVSGIFVYIHNLQSSVASIYM